MHRCYLSLSMNANQILTTLLQVRMEACTVQTRPATMSNTMQAADLAFRRAFEGSTALYPVGQVSKPEPSFQFGGKHCHSEGVVSRWHLHLLDVCDTEKYPVRFGKSQFRVP